MPFKRKPPSDNVRRVQTNGRNLRYTITNKAGRLVQCESQLERKLTLLLDRDATVQDYGSQPETLYWHDGKGKTRTYVPDFIVWRTNGNTELHEVTLTERQSDLRQQNRQQAADHICQQRGWDYLVHSEETLPNETVTTNLLALYAYRGSIYAHPDVEKHTLTYLTNSTSSFGDVCQYLEVQLAVAYPVIYMALLHLLWHDILQIDLRFLAFYDGKLQPNVSMSIKAGGV
jgi:hypothetical protein